MNLNTPDKVAHYVVELAGDRADDARHSLAEMGPAALPFIVQAFEATHDHSVAVDLLRVINEYRTLAALPFLGNLLRDNDPHIWKTALDGIVAIGGDESAECLGNMCETSDAERRSWLKEAIEQVKTRDG